MLVGIRLERMRGFDLGIGVCSGEFEDCKRLKSYEKLSERGSG